MFEYTGCGLDGIYLKNGYTLNESAYGKGVAIDNLEGLHRAIAADIVSQRTPMTGDQFRFLRKEQELVQQELAALFRVDVQTVANWEKKGHEAIPGPTDIAMRAFYSAFIHAKFGPIHFELQAQGDDRSVFQITDSSWTETEAA